MTARRNQRDDWLWVSTEHLAHKNVKHIEFMDREPATRTVMHRRLDAHETASFSEFIAPTDFPATIEAEQARATGRDLHTRVRVHALETNAVMLAEAFNVGLERLEHKRSRMMGAGRAGQGERTVSDRELEEHRRRDEVGALRRAGVALRADVARLTAENARLRVESERRARDAVAADRARANAESRAVLDRPGLQRDAELRGYERGLLDGAITAFAVGDYATCEMLLERLARVHDPATGRGEKEETCED